MSEHSSEADGVKAAASEDRNDTADGRAASPSRRRALATLASVPVLVTIKARSAYAVSHAASRNASVPGTHRNRAVIKKK
jgi:hypothetical protein